MTERLKQSIDIFLDAINEGTLAKGDCAACAVGNLVKHYNEPIAGKDLVEWKFLFVTGKDSAGISKQNIRKPHFTSIVNYQILNQTFSFSYEEIENTLIEQGERLIKDIPYSEEQLAKIEYTFETNTIINYKLYPNCSKKAIKQDQIKGLTAVIELMKTFDEDVDTDVKQVFESKVLLPGDSLCSVN